MLSRRIAELSVKITAPYYLTTYFSQSIMAHNKFCISNSYIGALLAWRARAWPEGGGQEGGRQEVSDLRSTSLEFFLPLQSQSDQGSTEVNAV